MLSLSIAPLARSTDLATFFTAPLTHQLPFLTSPLALWHPPTLIGSFLLSLEHLLATLP